MFKLPKNWYTINETNKTISILAFSSIAAANTTFNLTTGLGLKYISLNDANTFITIPNLNDSDTIIIRRKTLSEEKLVNFTAGSRLTSGQLNLTSNQLINILQELLWKVDKEVIIKYDKDAIDGPFLGEVGGSFIDITGNIDMNAKRITNLGDSSTLSDAMPKSEISDVVFRHGVITKDTAPVSNPGIENDVIAGTANEGRSGVWFNPQDGKLRAWAGNAWVIVTNAINPAVNPFLVQTNTAQSISGQKTFLAPTTFDSTVTATSNATISGNLTVDTNTLFVNASTDSVGIGTVNPTTKLDVNGTVTATAFAGPLTGNVTGNLTGTIQTEAQPNITSTGALTAPSLNVEGNITGSTVGALASCLLQSGCVLQVVFGFTQTSTTLATGATQTALTASITPKRANSRIIVIMSNCLYAGAPINNDQLITLYLYRSVGGGASSNFQTFNYSSYTLEVNSQHYNITTPTQCIQDTVASTAQHTYTVYGQASLTDNGSTRIARHSHGNSVSSMILVEVAA